jgi:NADH-quinone oxidoreductase subunit F
MAEATFPKILLDFEGHAESWTLDSYRKRGGYKALEKALKMEQAQIIEEVKNSGLRGRGGAGFPTGLKWTFLAKNDRPKYLVCNADEGEPGTFKDRYLMENDPHKLVEGMVISSFALGSRTSYIYFRHEFELPFRRLEAALADAEKAGLLGENILGSGFSHTIVLHRGAGAYICGEETGLIESLEGKKGQPRLKPPFPAVKGLFGDPTVVNNVESIMDVPWIITQSGADYKKYGTEKSPGTKLFSVSGHVNKPGVYEVPLGKPLLKFLEEEAGGMLNGMKLKCCIPGGSSVPVLTAEECEKANLDYESMNALGTFLGSGGVIFIGEGTCMVETLENLSRFYANESCGQCTPCRDGTHWLYKIVHRIEQGGGRKEDLANLLDLCDQIMGKTICAFGDAAAMPVVAFVKKYTHEFEEHIEKGCCPYKPAYASAGAGH